MKNCVVLTSKEAQLVRECIAITSNQENPGETDRWILRVEALDNKLFCILEEERKVREKAKVG